MLQDRLILTPKDILEKEFKIDTRGYRPQEVDKFLDIIIHDYETFSRLLKTASREKEELVEENISLKQEIRSLKEKLELFSNSSNDSSSNTADVLRRLSNLEKIVYDKEKE